MTEKVAIVAFEVGYLTLALPQNSIGRILTVDEVNSVLEKGWLRLGWLRRRKVYAYRLTDIMGVASNPEREEINYLVVEGAGLRVALEVGKLYLGQMAVTHCKVVQPDLDNPVTRAFVPAIRGTFANWVIKGYLLDPVEFLDIIFESSETTTSEVVTV